MTGGYSGYILSPNLLPARCPPSTWQAELPPLFLQQFKNYRLLSHHLKRASCHAAALSAHFKDEGFKE